MKYQLGQNHNLLFFLFFFLFLAYSMSDAKKKSIKQPVTGDQVKIICKKKRIHSVTV